MIKYFSSLAHVIAVSGLLLSSTNADACKVTERYLFHKLANVQASDVVKDADQVRYIAFVEATPQDIFNVIESPNTLKMKGGNTRSYATLDKAIAQFGPEDQVYFVEFSKKKGFWRATDVYDLGARSVVDHDKTPYSRCAGPRFFEKITSTEISGEEPYNPGAGWL